NEIHRKTIKFLTDEFDVIVIPPFEVSVEEKGIYVIIQNEVYTSKTCSWCGNIQKIGGSEVYNCRNCRTVMDRDENGAWRIFLRALLDEALILSGDHAGN
ncbi:17106_t:CDS:2, partial [Funneliformis geosporum]